jgi:hypothetical protein
MMRRTNKEETSAQTQTVHKFNITTRHFELAYMHTDRQTDRQTDGHTDRRTWRQATHQTRGGVGFVVCNVVIHHDDNAMKDERDEN